MKYHIHTYGCQMNERDSEAVGALFESRGIGRAETEDEADIVLVNTCSVRAKAEDKAMGKLGLLCASKRERPSRIIGVMGCMAQRMEKELFRRLPGLNLVVGTRATALVPEAVERAMAGERKICLVEAPKVTEGAEAEARADVVTAHEPGALAQFVTILLGCERKCAYCIVPTVRGGEYSRPGADVVKEVAEVVRQGAKDVTLLGQSVMRYGIRGASVWPAEHESAMGFREPLPRLFEAVHQAVPELRRIRFTSGHPSGVTPELVRAMAEVPGVCPHLHLPVQSGSDRVLAVMGRGYTRAEYLEAVASLRTAVPDIAITTDVIVGFPGETEEDFEMTRTLLDEAKVDNVFVFKYSPRPGTRSALWPDDVSDEEKLRRNHVLLEDQDRRGRALNEAWVGRCVEVLVEGPSLRNKERWSGRSPQNKLVVFEPIPGLAVGDFVEVEITEARPQILHGEIRRKAAEERCHGG